jgi:hypothetical protein
VLLLAVLAASACGGLAGPDQLCSEATAHLQSCGVEDLIPPAACDEAEQQAAAEVLGQDCASLEGRSTFAAGAQTRITLLVGGPNESHTYGHSSLRVTTKSGERVYDYGRYGATWGPFKSEGQGILRVWTSFPHFIAEQKATGRSTTGFTYNVSELTAQKVINYFRQRVGARTPVAGSPSWTAFHINTYDALRSNCTTLTLKGATVALPTIAKNAALYNIGRGLNPAEKLAAKTKGWPSGIFMPADLKAMLEAGTMPRWSGVLSFAGN